MASGDVDDYELEKIRAEIQQEKQMKDMLEQSARELRITVEELEKRYDSIENEDGTTERGNEWKTRFETQEEMNQQLERQIIVLQDKVEEAKRNLKDVLTEVSARAVVDGKADSSRADTPKSRSTGITINISVSPQGTPRCTVEAKGQGHALSGENSAGKTPRDMKSFDDLSDANPAMVKSMEKEKQLLYNQLRDLEWRLDHESKAYHKANDERKQYVVEINATKNNIEGNKARQRAAVTLQQHEVEEMSRSPRLMGNIPEDQRILDPRRGPIKKTAAVKTLPSIDTS